MSDRTRAAFQAKRDHGEPLGNPNILEVAQVGTEWRQAMADEHATKIQPIIDEVQRAGITTLSGIAEALNARGARAARGAQWHECTIRNALRRR